MTIFLQASFEGLALGAVYSLVAIGFVLIYKAMDVLSFAQPALAVVGAGIISALAVDRGINFWIAFIVALIATGLLSALLERTFLRPMVGQPVFAVAILTIGLDIILRTVLDEWIGINPRYMGDPIMSWGEFGSITILDSYGGVIMKLQEIGALITAGLPAFQGGLITQDQFIGGIVQNIQLKPLSLVIFLNKKYMQALLLYYL